MPFYTLIFISTALIGCLTYLIWRKTRSLMFPFGALCLYFWSLHGAWGIIFDKRGGDSGLRYHYIESKLFTIFLNESYFLALTYYAVFCILVLSIALVFTSASRDTLSVQWENRPAINHPLILFASVACGVLSYLLIADAMVEAIVLGQTAYAFVRADVVQFYTIHQILARAALVISLTGLAIVLCKENSIYFRARFRIGYLLLYGGVAAILTVYMIVLGNKNSLFGAFVMAALIYVAHNSAPKIKLFSALGLVFFLVIGSIDYLRGFAILSGGMEGIIFEDLLSSAATIFMSNEAFGAHFSMYGILEHDIVPTFGRDIGAFLLSAIPINLWPSRPVGVYGDYVAGVNAAVGQGYTIHHASAWYLDFGFAGILLGAIVLGALWVLLYNKFLTAKSVSGHLSYVFWTIAPFAFAAYFPNIVRTGVTAYKGVIIEAFIIPILVFYLASVRWKIIPRDFMVQTRDT